MSTVAAKLITAEEFGAMEDPIDGSKQELVRGEIVTMPPPKGRHGYVQGEICARIRDVVKPKKLGWVLVESGVVLERDPDTVRGPDVSFYSITRHPSRPDDYFEIPPDLVVEVLSPDDRRREVMDKIREYLANGVRLVWLVNPDPEVLTVTVYRGTEPGVIFEESDTITGGDVLPEFSCQVGAFFSP